MVAKVDIVEIRHGNHEYGGMLWREKSGTDLESRLG
jgi:hypothetical protein